FLLSAIRYPQPCRFFPFFVSVKRQLILCLLTHLLNFIYAVVNPRRPFTLLSLIANGQNGVLLTVM
ncbi:hypothetical protein, partial [Erwinia billingiae]|uniref:hypothetical protein n=1 Tax=Erwinia billingiae TaxID=182337 RepID=UPI0019D22BDA